MIIMFEKTPAQLERESIERQALEKAARHLETQEANPLYMQAWKRAARIIRSLKAD
ncbi:hypothetical protein GWE18_00280 [Bradyrhizobium sp. CSA112]|uniref:hypothetical protein n=1 Tax=Bradyrhizobium sp. CSA112 TaxID=2699170 RepID=UPI0023B09709|nr:hypothetical protein [Bradyrhizobium sp. CSA112]MDE5451313.1 hypothetical protein [Bradyrhizobium sp. CSA112]